MIEVIESFERGRAAIKVAEKTLEIDLPTSASRLYISGENLAYSLLLYLNGSASRDHGKLWNGIQILFEKGILKNNYRQVLEESYRLRIKGDYGRDIGGAVLITKEKINEQIKRLKELETDVEVILKEKGLIK